MEKLTQESTKLLDLYKSSANFLAPKVEDWKLMGVNEQGFPIIKSEEENTSFSFIEFDWGLINMEMVAFKLVRKMKDGSLAPLFINKKLRLPIGVWMDAEEHPTKGFAIRKGWHCTLTPKAPHLSTKNRVWVKVKVSDIRMYDRPESQGGTWVLAQKMLILGEI